MKRFIALLLSILFSFYAMPGVSAAAAQDAADNDASKPIQFTGDTDYNGYY